MDLKALQKEAHAIAKDHGWWNEERTFGDLIALVHSELSEALEAYREHGLKDWRSHTYDDGFVDEHPHGEKPEGVASELADVVIRVADMAEWYGVEFPTNTENSAVWHIKDIGSFGDWITECHLATDDVWKDFRRFKANPEIICGSLWGLLGLVFSMAAHYGTDLDAAIEAKMQYNRGRSYRHGEKAL